MSRSFQPHHMPFIKNLGVLGIEANVRMVDAAQERARLNDFDFDIAIQRFGFSTVPGDSLRLYFSSRAAATKGSQNLAGISDPVIDALIEQIVAAPTPAGSCDGLQGARSRDPRRPLLGAAMVQGVALARLLGRVRPAGAGQAEIWPRHSRDVVVRSAKSGATGAERLSNRFHPSLRDGFAGKFRVWILIRVSMPVRPRGVDRNSLARLRGNERGRTGSNGNESSNRVLMGAYIIRRLLLMIPTLVRHHAGLVRGDPARARRAGGAHHRAIVGRRYRGVLACLRFAGR